MNVYSFEPLRDARWARFVERAPRASVFHTPGWLRALHQTYGFTTVAFTTSPPADELADGVVLARVRSWLTGARLVSLPFSDHCEPLVDDAESLAAICNAVLAYRAEGPWKYVEIRPVSSGFTVPAGFTKAQAYCLHRLDLRPELDVLFRALHKDSIQRKIRRAEREGLVYQAGTTETLVRDLYHLLDLTRRRHRTPLQPLAWFRNLVTSLGDRLCIRVAYRGTTALAAILTITHARTMVYKYGGSDAALHPLGGMPLLFWNAIREARASGTCELDFGRSDADNPGLMTFKDRWGASRSALTYWRAPEGAAVTAGGGWKAEVAGRVLSALPGPLRRAAGGVLYPHIG